MAEYEKHHAEIQSLGFDVVAISVDASASSRALKQKLKLSFSLLSDPSHETVVRWSLLNTHERGGIAYPATFVIDREQHVRFRSLERTAARVDLNGLLGFLRAGLDSQPPPSKPKWVLPSLSDWALALRNLFGKSESKK